MKTCQQKKRTGYEVDLGYDQGGKYISEISAPKGVYEWQLDDRVEVSLYSEAPRFVHLSLYRSLNLTFPGDILACLLMDHQEWDGTETKEQAVGVLTPAMFNAE